MLKIAGQSIFVGLAASTLLLAAPIHAADKKEVGYLVDSSGKGVMSASGCVIAPNQAKKGPVEPCDVKDSDGDGVPDNKDKCPHNTPEEISKGVDADGCPLDSDGDGVPDYRDRCPNTPADQIHKVGPDGCVPVEEAPVTPVPGDIIRMELNSSVYFDFDKSVLKPAGKDALKQLVDQVINVRNVSAVQVVGHTDHIGSEAYNLKLSERRAKAAADYLIALGVPAEKITVIGKGESEAKGRTKAERAQDRKVVVDVHTIKEQ